MKHESYSEYGMVDALFGSKTRVKLLHLFMNNPGKSFYVREITRMIDEQINSVRRELSNMLTIGIIESDTSDNKLYYSVNQRYEHYVPLRAMFTDDQKGAQVERAPKQDWYETVKALPGLRIAVVAGVLVKASTSSVDALLVGDIPVAKLRQAVKQIERSEGREINYSVMPYDEFYYRLSVRDRFLTEVLKSKYLTLFDDDNVLQHQK